MYSEQDVERAWRNGWGSALNFLRAADRLANENGGNEDKVTRAIISDLVNEWVSVIDRVTEEAVECARIVGFAQDPESDAGTT